MCVTPKLRHRSSNLIRCRDALHSININSARPPAGNYNQLRTHINMHSFIIWHSLGARATSTLLGKLVCKRARQRTSLSLSCSRFRTLSLVRLNGISFVVARGSRDRVLSGSGEHSSGCCATTSHARLSAILFCTL